MFSTKFFNLVIKFGIVRSRLSTRNHLMCIKKFFFFYFRFPSSFRTEATMDIVNRTFDENILASGRNILEIKKNLKSFFSQFYMSFDVFPLNFSTCK